MSNAKAVSGCWGAIKSPSWAGGIKRINPMLLTLDQLLRLHQLENTEFERSRSMLAPRTLHRSGYMNSEPQISKVRTPSLCDVDGRADIDAGANNIANAIDSRTLFVVRSHALLP
jgi:hypothetical protein